MRLNPMQRAFSGHGKQMTYGALFVPDFDCPGPLLIEAANEIAQHIPAMRAYWHGDQVQVADRLTLLSTHPRQHLDHPSCFKIAECEEGYWLSFTHEFLDGWSYSRLTHEIFRVAAGGKLRTYETPTTIGKIVPNDVFNPRLFNFEGIEGEAMTTTIVMDDTYLKRAKAAGMRVQDFLAQAACEALGNPNIVTSKILEGFEHCFGHYSLYGSGSVKDDVFSLDCSHENFTRLMIAHGMSETNGNCFVGSFPMGQTNYETPAIFQMLKKNQMGRVQAVSMNGQHLLRIALNQGIPDKDAVIETILDAFA